MAGDRSAVIDWTLQGREKGKGKREKEMPGNGKTIEIIAKQAL